MSDPVDNAVEFLRVTDASEHAIESDECAARIRAEIARLREDLAEAVSILYECRDMGVLYLETRKRLEPLLRRYESRNA